MLFHALALAGVAAVAKIHAAQRYRLAVEFKAGMVLDNPAIRCEAGRYTPFGNADKRNLHRRGRL